MTTESSRSSAERSPAREFGHARHGYAVEFNFDGVSSCRTLTVETREEAEMFKRTLESKEDVSKVRVVVDR